MEEEEEEEGEEEGEGEEGGGARGGGGRGMKRAADSASQCAGRWRQLLPRLGIATIISSASSHR